MPLPVISIVGLTKSGKTTVASALVRTLVARGYRVGAVKHCHDGYDLDRPGSDTDRFSESGASVVVASSPSSRTVTSVDQSDDLDSVLTDMTNVDVVVAEGFKNSAHPKVLVNDGRPFPFEVDNVVATVGEPSDLWDVPTFGYEDTEALVDLVCELLLQPTSTPDLEVQLLVDGQPVPLKDFPTRALAGMVEGFISSLSGVPESPGDVQVSIRRHR